MTAPKAPYYCEETGDTYHWETSCSLNNYPGTGWTKSNDRPTGKEQCNQCKSK